MRTLPGAQQNPTVRPKESDHVSILLRPRHDTTLVPLAFARQGGLAKLRQFTDPSADSPRECGLRDWRDSNRPDRQHTLNGRYRYPGGSADLFGTPNECDGERGQHPQPHPSPTPQRRRPAPTPARVGRMWARPQCTQTGRDSSLAPRYRSSASSRRIIRLTADRSSARSCLAVCSTIDCSVSK